MISRRLLVVAGILLFAGVALALQQGMFTNKGDARPQTVDEQLAQFRPPERKVSKEDQERLRDLEDKRVKQANLVASAPDDSLLSLWGDCERRISHKITSENKPAFAVYFPNYTPDDLNMVSTAAAAMRLSMGRPSALFDEQDARVKKVRRLRLSPYSLSLAVESASDSFSGVKRWAAVYECELEGLSVRSVGRLGALQFFD